MHRVQSVERYQSERLDVSAKVHPLRYLLNLGCQTVLATDKQQYSCFGQLAGHGLK